MSEDKQQPAKPEQTSPTSAASVDKSLSKQSSASNEKPTAEKSTSSDVSSTPASPSATDTSNNTSNKKAAAKKSSSGTNQSTAAQKSETKSGKKSDNAKKNKTDADNQSIKTTSKAQSAASAPAWPGVLALLLVLAAIAAGAYGAWLFYGQQQQLAALNSQNASLTTQLASLQSDIEQTQSALQAERKARDALQNEQQALQQRFDTLSTRLGRTSVAWRLAELEYLLSLANYRVEFLQDINTAVTILESADKRLAQLADPGLIPVRQAIADELLALRSVQQPDISGIALQLGSLADDVAQLPLVDQQRIEVVNANPTQDETEATTWRDIPRVVWENIKSLVQIRRHSQPVEPLLPAKESWYLIQNLRLKLEQARLAALRQDTALFRQSLQEAASWIEAYYDQDAQPVKTTLQTLNILLQAELTEDLPDISTSLRLLREFNTRQGISAEQQLTDGAAEQSTQ